MKEGKAVAVGGEEQIGSEIGEAIGATGGQEQARTG